MKNNISQDKSKERKIEAPQVQVDLEKEIKKNQIMFVKNKRSPKRIVKNRNSKLSKDFQKSGHSQTVDWLRHTIKSKNEQLKSLNIQAHNLKDKIGKQIEFVKSFETISKKLKDRLESWSSIVKKINQCSMIFLNFYKDFVDMLKENQDILNQTQENRWLQLRDQLEACLKSLDIETNDKCNTNNQAIFKELQELLNKYNNSDLDISSMSRNFAPCSPKTWNDDNLNFTAMSLSGEEKTWELTSPISASYYGSKRDISASSLSWVLSTSNPESLRKDILRLTEENKYLKKRVTGDITKELSNTKCVIKNFRSEREFIEQLQCQRDMYDTKSYEFEILKLKYEDQNKDLIKKIENELAMISKIEELNNKNKDLNNYINNLLTTKEGFDSIHNTVSDLSLALISKNDKELTLKQRNIIKDLFSNSQIKAIDALRQKWLTLEIENSKAYELAKNQIEYKTHWWLWKDKF